MLITQVSGVKVKKDYKKTYKDINSKDSKELIEPFQKTMFEVLKQLYDSVERIMVTKLLPGSVKVSESLLVATYLTNFVCLSTKSPALLHGNL